ncbi:MAG: ECF-type sigma factor, partial [Planctomycetota bacterium]
MTEGRPNPESLDDDPWMALTFDELHRVAQQLLSGERRGHTLQPTALVNEAWLRLQGQERWN